MLSPHSPASNKKYERMSEARKKRFREQRADTKPITRSSRAGLTLPVARIHRYLKKGRFAPQVSDGAAVYLGGVLEYVVSEILDTAAIASKDNKKKRITPRYIELAIRNDDQLNKLLPKCATTIAQGGVPPQIHRILLPKKTATARGSTKEEKKTENRGSPGGSTRIIVGDSDTDTEEENEAVANTRGSINPTRRIVAQDSDTDAEDHLDSVGEDPDVWVKKRLAQYGSQ